MDGALPFDSNPLGGEKKKSDCVVRCKNKTHFVFIGGAFLFTAPLVYDTLHWPLSPSPPLYLFDPFDK